MIWGAPTGTSNGVKHDRLNLFQTLSTMLRKLIDSTSNALLGATGSPSKDKQNIYNIMEKHASERQTPCIGTGKFLSLSLPYCIVHIFPKPSTRLTLIFEYVAFYEQIDLLPGDLLVFPQGVCGQGEDNFMENAILTYLFQLQHYISSLAQNPHLGMPQATSPRFSRSRKGRT